MHKPLGKSELYISVRQIKNLNQEVITIKLSSLNIDWFSFRNISISRYVNVDGQEVLFLKPVKEIESKMNLSFMLKAYIKKEGVWSEIESDSQQSLSD